MIVLLAGSAVACDAGGGYEVVERDQMVLALAAPSAADTLPTISTVRDAGNYPCARLLPGAEASWQSDTMVVRQTEASGGRAGARVFCVPYNVPARTQGVESTERTYPPQPHGEEPGYAGWMSVSSPPV